MTILMLLKKLHDFIFTARNEVGARLFLHVSAILLTGGGGVPQFMLGPLPPGSRHPSDQASPRSRHPPGAVHAGRYGQQAGGTHPTGMHSCFICHSQSPAKSHLSYHSYSVNDQVLGPVYT